MSDDNIRELSERNRLAMWRCVPDELLGPVLAGAGYISDAA